MRAVRLLYPPLCVTCGEEIENDHGLCSQCWTDTFFIRGAICDSCGRPLPGQEAAPDLTCESCARTPPFWDRGRAAILYEGAGRRATLSLKHGDRLDVAKTVSKWMVEAGRDLLANDPVLVPVPLHWTRMLKRKYNQAAVLSSELARFTRLDHIPDALVRTKRTKMQKGMTREERFDNQAAAIEVSQKRVEMMSGRSVLLVDDVLTTGATLSACTAVCLQNGAATVNVLVLARVARLE